MIFYGDATSLVDPQARLDAILRRPPGPDPRTGGLAAHTDRVRLFLDLAELTTAVADATEEAGAPSCETERQLRAALLIAAHAVDISWRHGTTDAPFDAATFRANLPPLKNLPARPLPFNRPEGYAYYALYPELYGDAARAAALSHETCVMGLRSIGTGLAAMVAAACGSTAFWTLRPHGPPFARTVTLPDDMRQIAGPTRTFAIVDEGPGLSGSSFLGSVDALAQGGIGPDRVSLFPSHAHGPGGAARPDARARWQSLEQHLVPFEHSLLNEAGDGRLASWVSDITGPRLAPVRDLSGGRWRTLFDWRETPPIFPMQERRKYLFTGPNGRFLAKFVGLGAYGDQKVDLQAQLADSGFVAPVAGTRHGFLITPWLDGHPLETFNSADERQRFLTHLGDYLGYRARACPAEGRPGADLTTLAAMARYNLQAATGREQHDLALPSAGDLHALSRELAPIRIDGRLHAWEWLRRPDGTFVKCDAIDHHAGHDLVGCQDISWDIAGAAVEFALDENEIDGLRRDIISRARRLVSPVAVATMRTCYIAFQLGLWTFARDSASMASDAQACERRLDMYRRAALG